MMAVGAEYKAEYEKCKKLVAELHEARNMDDLPDEELVRLNVAIEAYEAKLVELEATGPSITDEILQKYYPQDNLPWSPEAHYVEDNVVLYEGLEWRALPDVEIGSPPDDVFNLEENTGGWAPVGETFIKEIPATIIDLSEEN